MNRILTLIIASLCWTVLSASPMSVRELRKLADSGTPCITDQYTNRVPSDGPLVRYVTTINENLSLKGLVTRVPSGIRLANNELPFQSSFYDVNIRLAQKCAYMEDPDGKAAVQLLFLSDKTAQMLNPAAMAELNLNGCILIKEGDRYIIDGLKTESVVSVGDEGSAPVPERVLNISDLTSDDIFTYVTLKDCEFAIKNGNLINVDETYIAKNKEGRNLGRNHADGWERVIIDTHGNKIYMHVNGNMTGRRNLHGIPKGVGTISGIIVDTYNPHYGQTHTFGIRPGCSDDIHFNSSANGYNILAAWDWNRKTEGFIPAEFGKGYMTTDVPENKIGRTHDFDNLSIDLPKDNKTDSRGLRGKVDDGALQISSPACNWWNWDKDEPRSLILAIPAAKITGTQLFVAFTMSAGCQTTATSQNYPSYWNVSYSSDGKNFISSDEKDATMRSLPVPWISRNADLLEGYKYEMSAECGLGYTEHVFYLPAELLGSKIIYIKIAPSKKIVATLAYLNRDCRALRQELSDTCYVNFGEIVVGYR